MRILEVSEHYFPHVGGISEHVHSLSKELIKQGHEVEILTSWIPGMVPEDVPVVRVGRGIRLPINKSFSRITLGIGVWASINRLLKKRKYDVIHVHGSLAPMLPMAVLHYSRNDSQTAAIGTFHAGHDPSSLYKVFKQPLRRQFFRYYDGLIAVSPIAEETMSLFFPGKYTVIPNGVDTDTFSPGTSALENELPSSSLKLLFMGRFDPKKGIRYLLSALPLIKQIIPDVQLVLCGGGPMKAYYKRYISREIADSIHFAGEITGPQRREFYRWCDISVTPSIGAESFGLTLLEAMACGKPVVASDIPAFRWVMSENEGRFFKPCDSRSLARTVIDLASEEGRMHELALAGRMKALAYSWPSVAKKITDYFLQIIRRRQNEILPPKETPC